MLPHTLLSGLVAALAAVVLVLPAYAQEKDPAKAQAAFEAAKVLHEKGDFAGSLAKLREAYDAYPDPAIKVSIARRLLDMDEPAEALAELSSIETRNRRLKKAVEAEKLRIQDMLAQDVPVLIDTEPAGAMIKIGTGEPVRAPLRRLMKRGSIQVIVTLEGHRALSEVLRIKGTKSINRSYKLDRIVSRLTVEVTGVDPEREEGKPFLKLNGKVVAPGSTHDVDAGRHNIACGYAQGAPPTTLRVRVPEGKNAVIRCAVPAPMDKPISWRAPVGWTSVGTGAAALGAGIGILVSHVMDSSAYEEPRYSITSTSKPVAGGVVTGLGAALVGLGTYLLLSE